VSSASAADNVAAGTAQTATATNGVLNIATLGTTTGSAVVSTTNTGNASVGLVNVSSLASDLTAGTTQTATLLSTGTLVVYSAVDSTATNASSVVVTGGTISNTTGGTPSTAKIASDGTSYTQIGAGGATFAVAVKPNAGVTSMTVRLYTNTSTTLAAQAASPSSGTLGGQIVVTIASASTAGVVSTAKSGIYYANDGAGGTDLTADTTSSNTTSHKYGSTIPWSQTGYARISVLDSYGSPIAPSATGLLTATATNGVKVALGTYNATVTASPDQTSAFLATTHPDATSVSVAAPSSTPVSTTVTISWNGSVIGTKTWNFTGAITKVTLSAASRIQLNGTAATSAVNGAAITFADAAGNVIYPVASDNFYPTSGYQTDSSSDAATLLSVVPTSTVTGYIDWTGAALAGKQNVTVDYINIDGTIAKSNTIVCSNAGTATTYAIAYDKSTYAPGSVATLTVTLKDSKGNLAADDQAWAVANSHVVAIGGGSLSVATSNADKSALGLITYSVITIVTEGTYQTTVKFPAISSSVGTLIAGYSLAGQGTTLNDVLKGIVSLIASINKQIAALAKLVAPKKK
jgi:hypothetical protein